MSKTSILALAVSFVALGISFISLTRDQNDQVVHRLIIENCVERGITFLGPDAIKSYWLHEGKPELPSQYNSSTANEIARRCIERYLPAN